MVGVLRLTRRPRQVGRSTLMSIIKLLNCILMMRWSIFGRPLVKLSDSLISHIGPSGPLRRLPAAVVALSYGTWHA